MARPAEKIAQLEAALEKKDQEISVLKLTSRRLEEELNQLKALVEGLTPLCSYSHSLAWRLLCYIGSTVRKRVVPLTKPGAHAQRASMRRIKRQRRSKRPWRTA
jgi:hypothetical protein